MYIRDSFTNVQKLKKIRLLKFLQFEDKESKKLLKPHRLHTFEVIESERGSRSFFTLALDVKLNFCNFYFSGSLNIII